MKPWIEMQLPEIAEILHFAFPIEGRMLVRTADGLHCLKLVPSVSMHQVMTADEINALDNGDSWGPERSQKLACDGHQWFLHGADSGDVTLCDLSTGERIEMAEPNYDVMLLKDSRSGTTVQQIEFSLAGDDAGKFSIAGFSQDEQFLILCSNDLLRIFCRSES